MAVCVRGGCASVGFRPVTGRGLFLYHRNLWLLFRQVCVYTAQTVRNDSMRNGGRVCTRKFQRT